jgi:TrmH RNA methyltransferase
VAGRKKEARKEEVKVCGLNAVRALAERRREDIVRVYLVEPRIPELSALLKWCAQQKKPYRVVGADEIAKVAESVHHEGVCVVAKAKAVARFADLLAKVRTRKGPESILVLDHVRNPHNLGAILRVAAHFGSSAILFPEGGAFPQLTSAIHRTAEGGAEVVDLVPIDPPVRALSALKSAGFTIYGTSGRATQSLYRERMAKRSVFLLGAEAEGLSDELFAACDRSIAIPGTGDVESLNVACASAVILGEWWRAHREHMSPPSGRMSPTE